MPVDLGEIERFQASEEGKTTITSPIFCGNCGYQLRMLPQIGRCPECGNHYNTISRTVKGIFTPASIKFPTFNLAAGLACLALLFWLVQGILQEFDIWALLLTAVFTVLTPIFIKQTASELIRFVHARQVARQMKSSLQDD